MTFHISYIYILLNIFTNMKSSLTLVLVLLCLTGLVHSDDSQFEDENLPMRPWFPHRMPHYQLPQQPKTAKKPFITPDCIKAKLALSDCVKEKLVSPWFTKPLVKDCCDPIAKHKKSCPALIVKIDELLIPHYIKSTCHASGPSAGPSSGPSAK